MLPTRSIQVLGSLAMISNVLALSRRGVPALILVLFGSVVTGLTPQVVAAPSRSPIDPIQLNFDSVIVAPARLTFDLVTSAGAAACLPNARGKVSLTSRGENQQMDVLVAGLPANTTFTVFLNQVPHAPFGLSSYEGDIHTDRFGVGRAHFIGIFSDETFVVAPGIAAAPVVHPADANTNPPTAPVHLFHLGVWFDATADAGVAGCPVGQTPFNGEHTAGIQVLNTTNFADGNGPIGQFRP
jgi:hypothetical protein